MERLKRERDTVNLPLAFLSNESLGRIASDPRKTLALTPAFELHALAESDKSREKKNNARNREKS